MAAIQTLQEVLDFLEDMGIQAFHQANEAYNKHSFRLAVQSMRQCTEAIAKGLIFKWNLDNPSSQPKSDQDTNGKSLMLSALLTRLQSNAYQLISINEAKKLEPFKELGNLYSHPNNAVLTQGEIENAKVAFRNLLNWFYEQRLSETIPDKLQKAMDGQPINHKEQERRQKFYAYFQKLHNYFTDKVFDEPVLRLADLYIQPGVEVWRANAAGYNPEKDHRARETFEELEAAPQLKDLVELFQAGQLPNYFRYTQSRMFLLLGYPGQGKTSFCREFLHRHYHAFFEQEPETGLIQDLNPQKLFYVRLRDIRDTRALFDKPLKVILEYLSEEVFGRKDGVEMEDIKDSTLLLDGLDEIAMRENSNQDEVTDFCTSLEREIERWKDMRVVLTSRYGYANLERLERSEIVVAELGRLSLEQQLDWLGRYRAQYPDSMLDEAKLREANEAETFKHIKELLDQPILLYLIAKANLPIDEDLSRGQIYSRLFDNLVNRAWEKNKQIDNLKGLKAEDLRQYLREIAFEIFKSPYEYIRKSDLRKLQGSRNFLKKLGKSESTDVFKTLMLAFYMQEVDRHGEDEREEEDKDNYAIEFLHKSLQEYLAAEYIWEEVKAFGDYNSRKKCYNIDSAQAAEDLLLPILGHKALSPELVQNLRVCIRLEENANLVQELFERLRACFWLYLKEKSSLEVSVIRSWTIAYFSELLILEANWVRLLGLTNRGLENFIPEIEEAYLARRIEGAIELDFLNGCKIRDWNFPYKGYNEVVIENILFVKVSIRGSLSVHNCSFEECLFTDVRFYAVTDSQFLNCNFSTLSFNGDKGIENSTFKDSEIKSCYFNLRLFNCIFDGCSFIGGYIDLGAVKNCDFLDLHLEDLTLHGPEDVMLYSKIYNISFTRGAFFLSQEHYKEDEHDFDTRYPLRCLRGVHVKKSLKSNQETLGDWFDDLSYSVLEDMEIINYSFHSCNLRRTSFVAGRYWMCDFTNVKAQKADFSKADLRHADFYEADLQEACFFRAKLGKADFKRADLRHANLCHADLFGANFVEANLAGANLAGADLENADLRGADLRDIILHYKQTYCYFVDFSEIYDNEGRFADWIEREVATFGLDEFMPSDEAISQAFDQWFEKNKEWHSNARLEEREETFRANFKGAIFDQYTLISEEQLAQAEGVEGIIRVESPPRQAPSV